jgi:4-carboxymuconolactone decarboxylase
LGWTSTNKKDVTMTAHTDKLGGRLPLLDPLALSAQQQDLYDRINATFGKWSRNIHFQSKTDDGRLIGPFNPILYSPGISASFLDLHDAEEKHTSLGERVRQVVILSVGAVWKSDYELYAHSAAARKASISENAIRILAAGGLPDDLSEPEKVAQRYARQFSAERCVDADLYTAAVHAFGEHGVVDLTYLIGIYHITCGLLNSFDIPAPDQAP